MGSFTNWYAPPQCSAENWLAKMMILCAIEPSVSSSPGAAVTVSMFLDAPSEVRVYWMPPVPPTLEPGWVFSGAGVYAQPARAAIKIRKRTIWTRSRRFRFSSRESGDGQPRGAASDCRHGVSSRRADWRCSLLGDPASLYAGAFGRRRCVSDRRAALSSAAGLRLLRIG